jgi:hypothetical protein
VKEKGNKDFYLFRSTQHFTRIVSVAFTITSTVRDKQFVTGRLVS